MVSLIEIENYARDNKVPIMDKDGINYLVNLVKKTGAKRILEIGTAIGYSSILMAKANNDVHVTTLERDKARYEMAIANIRDFHLEDRIDVVLIDALDYSDDNYYDLIFIDAAKGQYINFFNRFKNNLIVGGVIVSDNLSFHGYVNSDDIKSRNLRSLVKKIRLYIDFLKTNEEFETEFIEIGDGIGLSIKK